jgi:hypothetical protein
MPAEGDAGGCEGVAQTVDGGTKRLGGVVIVGKGIEEEVQAEKTKGGVGDGEADRVDEGRGGEASVGADESGEIDVEGCKGREDGAKAGGVGWAGGRGAQDEGTEEADGPPREHNVGVSANEVGEREVVDDGDVRDGRARLVGIGTSEVAEFEKVLEGSDVADQLVSGGCLL